MVSGGPMLNGYYRGERVGSGTHLWKFSEAVKAGEMTQAEFAEAEASMSRSPGSCNTMGTASTMASMMESLGMTLSGNAAIPAVDSRRRVMAFMSGRRIVEMVKDDLKPSDILTKQAFENAIRTNGAIGGSTNAVIHLLAIAGRVGIDLTLDDWDRCGRDVATIVNLMPSGKYLMEEFFYAGGLPVVIKRLGEAGLLHKDALTVSGGAIWDEVKDVVNHNEDVILPVEKALTQHGGIAVLRGNLAPNGAVLKPSAASKHLLKHTGRAVVFEDIDDYKAKINDDNLDIDENCIMVMKNCGPKGYPGMAEVGNMGLPPKVLKKGITDMVRISDARMSGTAYGTVVLHTSPEAAAGGPLAVVRDGDMIELDVEARRLHLDISDAELAARLAEWKPLPNQPTSGYAWLHQNHVQGADTGADLDFLKGCRGAPVGKDSH
jgi:L-arabonate dehydrase